MTPARPASRVTAPSWNAAAAPLPPWGRLLILSGTMRRYLSIWFPDWPLDRLRRARRRPSSQDTDTSAGPAEPQPFVLYEKSTYGLAVAAANPPAMAAGIHAGLSLKDARGALPGLLTEQIDRESDAAALLALADWMVRFSPLVTTDGKDGLLLETTGCDHLFGGEAGMAAALSARVSCIALPQLGEGAAAGKRAGIEKVGAGPA